MNVQLCLGFNGVLPVGSFLEVEAFNSIIHNSMSGPYLRLIVSEACSLGGSLRSKGSKVHLLFFLRNTAVP